MKTMTHRLRIVLCMALALLVAPASYPADTKQSAIDWPTFQGNNARTGASKYPPIVKPKIAWSAQVGIMGYLNCPVIDGDRVFVTSSGDTHNKSDKYDGVYCLSLKTGKVLWHTKTPIDACGISINKTHVFVGDDNGNVYALDRKTGKQAWTHKLPGSAFAQPLVLKDRVVFGGEGQVVACELKTGKVLWTYKADGAVRGGVSSDGKRIYAAFTQGRVVCLKPAGEVVWEENALKKLADWAQIYPAPTVSDQKAYFGFARVTYADVPALFCLKADGNAEWFNRKKGFRNAKKRSFGNIRSSPAVFDGSLVYAEPYGNELVWVDRTTGKFQKSVNLGAPMFPQWASPVIVKALIYIPRHDGGLYAVDIDSAKPYWMLYLGQRKQAGKTSLPDDILPKDTYGTEWKPNVGKPIYATPAVAKDGTLVIGTGEGWLYCITENPQ